MGSPSSVRRVLPKIRVQLSADDFKRIQNHAARQGRRIQNNHFVPDTADDLIRRLENEGFVLSLLKPLHGVLYGVPNRADLNGQLTRAVRWVPQDLHASTDAWPVVPSWVVRSDRDGEALKVSDGNIDFENLHAIRVDVEHGWTLANRQAFKDHWQRRRLRSREEQTMSFQSIYSIYLRPSAR